ncbi:lipocalin [Aquimarina sp. TRL1]|uniref:lipocalin family protein n=1 Tax=Aquimarina sp. (strain TRL1) TaxID=2736252 RepID=UPI00158BEA78|nr:lipocalin family protein [Aquimarina sp. TRL1]QKX06770.1 lipocalin [Aquimarina sp. TRL1]
MRLLFFIAVSAMVLTSCKGTSIAVQQTTKAINGQWTLNQLDYDAEGTYNITLFGGIPAKCVEGSQWAFVSNNNRGNYLITDGSCANVAGPNNFIWTVPDEMYGYDYSIMVKPVNAKYKSEINNKAYRMSLTEVKENAMLWTYEVPGDGEKVTIKLHFTRR